jgi:Heterokaryon incompatibility protein (HET)
MGFSATRLPVRQQQKPSMRLLSTSSWKLEDFTDSDIPKYAILSHRWEKEEITFRDLELGLTGSATKKGWSKLRGCVTQAAQDGFHWIWVDTCCIDKSSSAELSEAINSMFNWYKEAQVCYAYLSDVLYYPSFSELSLGEDESAFDECNSSFRSSNLFTRGWTLQELLAPGKLIFFDSQWRRIGERDNTPDMWELVSEITGIERHWRGSSVAQKMSWASKRETTRIEDRAYSLMGLFGVHMPPLYGEREKAFIRLQLEILRLSDDESIFAWRDSNDLSGGLLALSPNAFQLSYDTSRLNRNDQQPYWMTNKGLCMERQLLRPTAYSIDSDDTFILPLQCSPGTIIPYGIVLKCINGDQFARVSSGEFLSLPPSLLGDKMQLEVKKNRLY